MINRDFFKMIDHPYEPCLIEVLVASKNWVNIPNCQPYNWWVFHCVPPQTRLNYQIVVDENWFGWFAMCCPSSVGYGRMCFKTKKNKTYNCNLVEIDSWFIDLITILKNVPDIRREAVTSGSFNFLPECRDFSFLPYNSESSKIRNLAQQYSQSGGIITTYVKS